MSVLDPFIEWDQLDSESGQWVNLFNGKIFRCNMKTKALMLEEAILSCPASRILDDRNKRYKNRVVVPMMDDEGNVYFRSYPNLRYYFDPNSESDVKDKQRAALSRCYIMAVKRSLRDKDDR